MSPTRQKNQSIRRNIKVNAVRWTDSQAEQKKDVNQAIQLSTNVGKYGQEKLRIRTLFTLFFNSFTHNNKQWSNIL